MMQILGILGGNGKPIPNITVTMFRSEEDHANLLKVVSHKEQAFIAKRSESPNFNRTRAYWDSEFELHRDRLKSQGAEVRVFPLEQRERANNTPLHVRLAEHGIGL